MKTFIVSTLCLFVGGVQAAVVAGYSGGTVTVKCDYNDELKNAERSFCKGRRGECASKISGRTRNQWERRGRFSLYNNSTGRFFMVTIDQLRPEDAGTYRCSDAGDDAEVSLRVMEVTDCCEMSIYVSTHLGETLNISCHYMDVHQGTAKYLCKYYRSSTCEYKLSTSDDGAWVQSEKLALHDSRHQRTFTVTMNNLSRFDTGTYWCGVASDWESGGYRSLITKVHLTVTEPTVSPPTVTSYLLTKPSRSSLGEAGGHFAERETCRSNLLVPYGPLKIPVCRAGDQTQPTETRLLTSAGKTWSHPGHAAPRPSTSLTAVVGVDPTASSAPESGGHHSTALRVFVGLLVLLIISTMLLVTLGIVKRKKSGGRAASLEPYTPEKIQLTDGGKTHQASPEAQI